MPPPAAKSIPFAELVPGASVRVTEDNLIWAVDLAMVVTGKNRNDANEIFRDLNEETFNTEKILIKPMPGKGNGRTKLVTFDHALELIMVLPGKIAKEFRVKACDILKRYFAGDASLVAEIQANAASDAPVQQLARASLAKKRPLDTDGETDSKQLELAERRARLRLLEAEVREKEAHAREREAESYVTVVSVLKQFSRGGELDERDTLFFRDQVLNGAMTSAPAPLAITAAAGPAPPAPPSKPICISGVATAMGIKLNNGTLCRIGKRVAQCYRDKYDEDPPRHTQFVDGAARDVLSYTERERSLIEEVIREVTGIVSPPVSDRE